MEDDLRYFENGRLPQIVFKMDEDLNFFEMEDDLKRMFLNWKRTSIFFLLMEDNIKCFENERQPQIFENGKDKQQQK
jgi:hypothetical protein